MHGHSVRVRVLVLRTALALSVLGAVAGVGLLAARAVVGRSTRGRLYHDVDSVPSRSVAIVPGARVWADGRPSHPLVDRLETAWRLYTLGKVHRILVSGDHGRADYDEANAMRRYLVARGVPSDDVVLDHAGFRTLDTMDRAANVFGVTGAVVVTQGFHLPRSVYLARHAGIDAVGLEATPREYGGRLSDTVREPIAVARAVLDAAVLGTRARLLGPAVPVMGDATRSYDARTRLDIALERR